MKKVGHYQEKHSLLQAFSRQFTEAAQPDELLRKEIICHKI